MTSNDNPAEVMLFERYADLKALGAHGKKDEFKAMFKGTGKFIQGRKTVLSEWEEQEGSFVSNTAGGKGMGMKL
jgi:quinol monooxygenase YgiN